MGSIVVKINQSICDIAIEHLGALDAVIDLAFANGISITESLQASDLLNTIGLANQKTATLFGNLFNKPATAISKADERNLCDEVGDNTADFGTFDYTFNDSFYK